MQPRESVGESGITVPATLAGKWEEGWREVSAFICGVPGVLCCARWLPGWDPVRCCAASRKCPTFSTEVKVVNVLATVTDRKGAIIRDLTKDDFGCSKTSARRPFAIFRAESDLPLTLGLMVDTSMSQTRVLDAERGASFRFLEVALRPRQDRVFLMQFDFRIFIRQPLTSSLKQLDDALAVCRYPPAQPVPASIRRRHVAL